MTQKGILNKVDSIDLLFSNIQKSFYKIFLSVFEEWYTLCDRLPLFKYYRLPSERVKLQ